MQEEHRDGLVSPVKDFFHEDLLRALDDANVEKVTVFKKDSEAHENALKSYSQMTANQKRRMRRRLAKRK